jgi:hypothetical protein
MHLEAVGNGGHKRNEGMQDQKKLLNTDEAAAYLSCSAAFLNKQRMTGDGPVYVRMCRRIHYTHADLDAFIESHKQRHTAQNAA